MTGAPARKNHTGTSSRRMSVTQPEMIQYPEYFNGGDSTTLVLDRQFPFINKHVYLQELSRQRSKTKIYKSSDIKHVLTYISNKQIVHQLNSYTL